MILIGRDCHLALCHSEMQRWAEAKQCAEKAIELAATDEKALRSKLGLEDLPSYTTEKATMDELSEQNSYWINDLMKIKNKEE